MGTSTNPTPCYKNIRVSPKTWYFHLEHCPKRRTYKNFSTAYQSSTRVINLAREYSTLSAINWTVVGQLSWQYLRAPMLDRCIGCNLLKVIIKLLLQHDSVSRAKYRQLILKDILKNVQIKLKKRLKT